MTDPDPDDQPVLSVVKGRPTDEELAALIVVFSSARTTSGSAGAPVAPAGRPTGERCGNPSSPGLMPGDCRVVCHEPGRLE